MPHSYVENRPPAHPFQEQVGAATPPRTGTSRPTAERKIDELGRHDFSLRFLRIGFAPLLVLGVLFGLVWPGISAVAGPAPMLIKRGNLPVLFHANAEQLPRIFPIGTPRSKIHAKFGLPLPDSGSTAEQDVYSASMYYLKSTGRNSIGVMRTVSAHLHYDEAGNVKSVEPSIFMSYVETTGGKATVTRQATDAEIAMYLTSLNPAAVERIIAAAFPDQEPSPAKSAITAAPWRIGVKLDSRLEPTFRSLTNEKIVPFVTGFTADSLARGAGMEVGDVILEVNGQKVAGASDVAIKIGNADPLLPLVVKIQRGKADQMVVFQPRP